MIESGLFSRLRTQIAAVHDRVYPNRLPETAAYPAITYAAITDPRDHTHGGPSGLVEARYQITVWSDMYLEMKEVREDLRTALDGFTGDMGTVVVHHCQNQGGPDLYDDTARVHYGPTDYMIHYKES